MNNFEIVFFYSVFASLREILMRKNNRFSSINRIFVAFKTKQQQHYFENRRL
jgi:hypothetical protein